MHTQFFEKLLAKLVKSQFDKAAFVGFNQSAQVMSEINGDRRDDVAK